MQFTARALALLMIALVCIGAAPWSRVAIYDADEVDPRWLDRLEEADRHFLAESIGYAPPAFTDDLTWHSSEPLTWEALRGKVVIVQSWTSATSAGRAAPLRAARAVERFDVDDVVVLALHTPDGADNAGAFLERRDLGMSVVVDSQGLFCDELGFYKRPANVLVDRNGVVRYVGLNARGVTEAVESLVAETADPEADPQPRPAPQVEVNADVTFPTFSTPVGSATDMRGRPAPTMHVAQWLNGQPDATGKLVVIDFWATWCGPCRATIPHMNEMAAHYRDDVVCVGLSNESAGTVQNFMRTNPMNYYVAVDPQGSMQGAFGVRGIPNVAVMSADWVVRWQGHPSSLNQQVMDSLVQANRQLAAAAGTNARYRWTGAREAVGSD